VTLDSKKTEGEDLMRNIPLLLIPVAAYNFGASLGLDWNARVVWVLSIEHLLICLTLICMGIEVWRSAFFLPRELTHQMANLALFVVAVLELALVSWCQSGTFVVLTLATLVTLVDANFVSFVTKGGYVRRLKRSDDARLPLRVNPTNDGVIERASK
jgi:hypothetical protein